MRGGNSAVSQVPAGGSKGRTYRFLLSGEKENEGGGAEVGSGCIF